MSKAAQRVANIVLVAAMGAVFSTSASALEGAWYVGAGAGMSRLAPDTDGSAYTLDEEVSTAAGLYLGLDINDWLAAEAAYTVLGEATLSEEETIGYTAMSIGAIAYVYGQRDISARQQGLSGYVRLGLNSISNEATITLDQADNTAIWLGAGLQLPIGRQWGVRGEINSYDGDAQALLASVYWRSKSDNTRRSSYVNEPAPRAPQAETRAQTAPAPAPAAVPQPTTTPRQAVASNCSVPVGAEPRDSQGCGLISGVANGVDFQGDTAALTPVGQQLLSRLATTLNQNPQLVIELQVHTQQYSDPALAMSLSRERVLTVARYLASQSVDVKRLRARAFGSEQPRAVNNTAGGRRLNNRVVLQVLP